MRVRRPIGLNALAQATGLYVLLVAYSAVYEYFYHYQLTPLFGDMFTAYDPTRPGTYLAIALLTPLAVLPIGARLRGPGQFIAGSLAVLLFIPIPIVFVPMTTPGEYWSVYALLWTGYLILCSLSSLDVDLGIRMLDEAQFRLLLKVVFAIVGLGLLYVMLTDRIRLVSLSAAHAARHEVTVSGLQAYLIPSYVSSFGGLLLAFAMVYRRYYLAPIALAAFVLCYAAIEERTAAIMPFWIAFIFLGQKYFFRDSVIRFVLCIMAPFLALVGIAAIVGTANRESVFYSLFTLATYRVFSIPAIAFNVYYNFFHFNPHTYWSHINIVSKYVDNPYDSPLALVMNNAYRLGNYNASFLETDGLAAAGTVALPWICAFFGLVLVFLNSCLRGLGVRVIGLVIAGSCIVLMDVGIGPALLTNGLVLVALILLFAPRISPWIDT